MVTVVVVAAVYIILVLYLYRNGIYISTGVNAVDRYIIIGGLLTTEQKINFNSWVQ